MNSFFALFELKIKDLFSVKLKCYSITNFCKKLQLKTESDVCEFCNGIARTIRGLLLDRTVKPFNSESTIETTRLYRSDHSNLSPISVVDRLLIK